MKKSIQLTRTYAQNNRQMDTVGCHYKLCITPHTVLSWDISLRSTLCWCPIYNNKGCLFKMDHNVWVYFSMITFRESLRLVLIELSKVSISIPNIWLKLDVIHS